MACFKSLSGGILPVALIGILLTAGPGQARARESIAVIVHEQVPVEDLSLAELRRIFLGERQFWSRNLTITLLMPPRDSPERQVLLRKIYGQRSEAQYQHHWINKLFSDETQSAPKITGSPEMSASLARGHPRGHRAGPGGQDPGGGEGPPDRRQAAR